MKARYSLTGAVIKLGTPAPWVVYTSLALALAAVSGTAEGLFGAAVELAHFRDRAIGETTLAGVDASPYARTYVAMITGFTAAFLAAFVALTAAASALARQLGPEVAERRLRGVETLGQLALATLLLHMILREPSLAPLPGLLFGLIGLWLALAVLEAVVRWRCPPTWRDLVPAILEDRSWLFVTLVLALPAVFTCWVLFDRPMEVDLGWGLVVCALGALAVLASEAAFVRRRGTKRLREAHARLALAATALLLIPASIPVANELQYRFAATAPRTIAILLIVLLGAASAGMFFLGRRWRPSTASLLVFFYFPVLIATGYLFRVHRQTLHLGSLDYFHLGEKTLPTQQLFLFGKLPLADVRLAHTFSDMFYQTLYTMANGYRGLDMLLWESWMPLVVAGVVIYLVLARLTSPRFAFLAVLFLPVTNLLPPYYVPALVPFLFLFHALRRPTWGRFTLVWVSALLLALWRVDFGLVGFLSLAGVVAGYLLAGHRGRLRAIAVSLGAVAAATAVVLLGVAFLGGGGALVAVMRSYGYRLVTRTRPEIIESYSAAAVAQYYLLPAVGLVYVVYYAVRRLRGRRVAPAQSMLAAIAAFSLVISLRSLERHSLVESFNIYFFLFLLAALPFLFVRSGPALGRHRLEGTFFLVLVLTAVFALPPSSYGRADLRLSSALTEGRIFRFVDWEGDEPRITFDAERHQSLVGFLRQELAGDETFFDFTNSPLLYLLADKELASWMIPNLTQTSEPVQARVVADLDELRRAGRLPFVVMKQGNYFWDNTDGVPNEVRCYRVAEFLYRHYQPFAAIGPYELWQEKDVPREAPYFESIPARISDDYVLQNLRLRHEGERPAFEATGPDPQLVGYLDFEDVDLGSFPYWRLIVDYRLAAPGALQAFYELDGEGFSEERSAWSQASGGRVVVSLPGAGEAKRLTGLRLDPPEGSLLHHVDARLAGSDYEVLPLDPERWSQRWNVGRLPFVWASFDPLEALETTQVVAVLLEEERELDELAKLVLPLEGIRAADAGYLHLRLRSRLVTHGGRHEDTSLTATVTYGGEPASAVAFDVVIDPADAFAGYVPAPTGELVAHNLARLEIPEARLALEATGKDPWGHGLFDFHEVPRLEIDDELWIRLVYRSTLGGPLQLFFAFDDREFSEETSSGGELVETLAGEELILPVRGGRATERLMDVRFDPPEGAVFAIDELEVITRQLRARDYLVRLATQWRWSAAPVEELVLTVSGPVTVERVVLRRGD